MANCHICQYTAAGVGHSSVCVYVYLIHGARVGWYYEIREPDVSGQRHEREKML